MKKLLFCCLFLWFAVLKSNAQAFQWAHTQGENGSRVATDGDNLIAAAGLQFPITLGNQTFSTNLSNSCYVVKRNSGGTVLWARQLIGPRNYITVETDLNKNILVAGIYEDSLYINGLIFKDLPWTQRHFLAKFDPNGNLLWTRRSGNLTNGFVSSPELSTDGSGNIYYTSNYSNTLSFDNNLVTSSGHADVFLVKYNSQGAFQWIRNFGNANVDGNTTVICNQNNEVYLKSESFQYNGSTATTGASIYKLNGAGSPQWSKHVPLPWVEISLDSAGSLYLAAIYNDSVSFGNIKLNLTRVPNQNYLVMARMNAAGTWKWAGTVASGNYKAMRLHMAKKTGPHIYLAGGLQGTAVFGAQALTSTSNQGFLAKLDTTGFGQAVLQIRSSITGISQAGEQIAVDKHGEPFLSGVFGGLSYPVPGSISLGSFTLNTTGWQSTGYVSKVMVDPNTVSGVLFIDANGNGTRDAGEAPYENGMVEFTPGPVYTMSVANGSYLGNFSAGTYNLQVLQPASHYTFLPQNHSVSFTGLGQTQTKDFALVPIPNRNDVKVTVTNLTDARAGWPVSYRVTWHNVGTTVLADSVSLQYPTQYLLYNTASAIPVSHQPGKLRWVYQGLQPNEKRNIDVHFWVDSTANVNTSLQTIAAIGPRPVDFYPQNNTDSLSQAVIASLDPNHKQVSHATISPAQVTSGKLLDYTIRFQNTGNDTAFTVIVRDSISGKLQMPTFELLSASHLYAFRILPNGMAEWRFDNILLPDSNRNEPASHGFIRYRIRPKSNLVLGDEIKSRAAIYFDYNAPVLTNYAVTRVAMPQPLPLGFEEAKAPKSFRLYPNPARNFVTVEANGSKSGTAEITLVNMVGQTVKKVSLPAGNQTIRYELPLENLPKGIYLVKLETGNKLLTKRLVIQ